MNTLFNLDQRTAFITGGSKGIGKMITTAFLKCGANVIITARNPEACNKTVEELSQFGNISAIPGDISTLVGIDEVADKIGDKIDILVNNAGAGTQVPFGQFTEEDWDIVMDLNVKSLFFLTQKLAPILIKNGTPERPSKVINLASVVAYYNHSDPTPSYIASKAAVVRLTKHLAQELIRKNVVVTAIAPGAFPSDMNIDARDQPNELGSRIPAGRVGSWEDIGGTAVYLAARSGDWVVGETIVIDGGVAHTMPPG